MTRIRKVVIISSMLVPGVMAGSLFGQADPLPFESLRRLHESNPGSHDAYIEFLYPEEAPARRLTAADVT